ncbi:MAG: Rpn family recombination-promoting nuclease/putative transposase [Faecalibacterium prausnitzii]
MQFREVPGRAEICRHQRRRQAAYILLGIENQTDIHYAMPVRNAVYDALQYGRQVADIAKKHRREDASSRPTAGATHLSGFYKDDRLTPVITLALHFGANEWNGPLSLHEMMNVKNRELLRFVQDYQVHLIDPARLSEEELTKFSTSLREVHGIYQIFKDKKKLSEFLKENPRMLIEANAARVIKAVTNTPLDIPGGRGGGRYVQSGPETMMNESKTKGAVEVTCGTGKDRCSASRERLRAAPT